MVDNNDHHPILHFIQLLLCSTPARSPPCSFVLQWFSFSTLMLHIFHAWNWTHFHMCMRLHTLVHVIWHTFPYVTWHTLPHVKHEVQSLIIFTTVSAIKNVVLLSFLCLWLMTKHFVWVLTLFSDSACSWRICYMKDSEAALI